MRIRPSVSVCVLGSRPNRVGKKTDTLCFYFISPPSHTKAINFSSNRRRHHRLLRPFTSCFVFCFCFSLLAAQLVCCVVCVNYLRLVFSCPFVRTRSTRSIWISIYRLMPKDINTHRTDIEQRDAHAHTHTHNTNLLINFSHNYISTTTTATSSSRESERESVRK